MSGACDICGFTPCPTPTFCDESRAGDRGKKPHLISRRAAGIEPKHIEFIWPGRIARGKHTAIAGEPGSGKSQLSVYIASTISRGGEWPCGEGRAPVGNVIILNAEDGADDTVVPRLMAAGADLERVHIVSAVRQEDGKGRRTFNLQADLMLLEQKIAEIGDVALVIIDPISSYMGKTDSHKNAEVRGALEPLSEMADRLKVAILSITHFSKSGSGSSSKALHRFIGSIGFTGAPRAAFAVIEDMDNEGRILFLSAKNNMVRKPQGLAYRLLQTFVGKDEILASYVHFDSEPVTVSADAALRASEDGGDRSAAAEAEEFLRDKLSAGPVPAKDGEEHARALGIAPRTLARARKKLGVIAEKVGLKEGWTWSLPAEERQTPPKNAKEDNGSLRPHLAAFGDTRPPQPPKAVPTVDPSDGLDIPDYLDRRPRNGSARLPCAQCRDDDGKQELHQHDNREIWLHWECVRFWNGSH
jgi:putative DNA primase/helicase